MDHFNISKRFLFCIFSMFILFSLVSSDTIITTSSNEVESFFTNYFLSNIQDYKIINVTSCGILNESNTRYILQNNINIVEGMLESLNGGYCFYLTGKNSILELNGFEINTNLFCSSGSCDNFFDSNFSPRDNLIRPLSNESVIGDLTILERLTSNSPISTCEQLQNVSVYGNGYYFLVNDIDCSDTINWNEGKGFKPLGSVSTFAFNGTLDGRGFRIKNLYINRPTEDYVGLFGYAENLDITNLGLFWSKTIGNSYVGSLIGYGSNAKIEKSYAFGNVNGTSNVGGLVGLASGSIVRSSFLGDLGFVKRDNCYLYKNYIYCPSSYNLGGLIGTASNLNLDQSFFKGSLINGGESSGGLVGAGSNLNISNSYVDALIYGWYNAGGLMGDLYNSNILNSYSTGIVRSLRTPSASTSGIAGGIYSPGGNILLNSVFSTSLIEGSRAAAGLGIGYWFSGSYTDLINSSFGGSFSDWAYIAPFIYWSKYSLRVNEGNLDLRNNPAYLKSPLRSKEIFNSWDFDNVWQDIDGSYPELRDAARPESYPLQRKVIAPVTVLSLTSGIVGGNFTISFYNKTRTSYDSETCNREYGWYTRTPCQITTKYINRSYSPMGGKISGPSSIGIVYDTQDFGCYYNRFSDRYCPEGTYYLQNLVLNNSIIIKNNTNPYNEFSSKVIIYNMSFLENGHILTIPFNTRSLNQNSYAYTNLNNYNILLYKSYFSGGNLLDLHSSSLVLDKDFFGELGNHIYLNFNSGILKKGGIYNSSIVSNNAFIELIDKSGLDMRYYASSGITQYDLPRLKIYSPQISNLDNNASLNRLIYFELPDSRDSFEIKADYINFPFLANVKASLTHTKSLGNDYFEISPESFGVTMPSNFYMGNETIEQGEEIFIPGRTLTNDTFRIYYDFKLNLNRLLYCSDDRHCGDVYSYCNKDKMSCCLKKEGVEYGC